MKLFFYLILFLVQLSSFSAFASSKIYDLEVKRNAISLDGKESKAITVNGTLPAPTLYFKEGDEAEIRVKNSMTEVTSIHWHGILLPGNMDGVPGLNGFAGIPAGETFTYRFKIRQAGTYWYHSHSNLQEQDGLYGAIVVEPKGKVALKSDHSFDREYVILLSDFSEESAKEIFQNLKLDSGYYNYNKRTLGTFLGDAKKYGILATIKDRMAWGEMRMDATDLSDVSKYSFLINGKTPQENFTGIFKKNERIKLRFVNASTMTFYDVAIPNLKMKLVEADGQPVKSVMIDEFRIAPAETYDVIVEPKENKAYTIMAESLDRTGYARATLAPTLGMEAEIPQMRPRAILTMADMGNEMGMEEESAKTGWDDAGTPEGNKALKYSDLISLKPQTDLRQETREIELRFAGNMNRYIWTINGEKFPAPIHLKYGERLRLKFVNDTMMAHPIHLHGMFMQLENGQPLKSMPNKHTVIVAPGKIISTLLTADEEGEWAFHCHLLYHMSAGMMGSVTVSKEVPNAKNTSDIVADKIVSQEIDE